MKWKSNQRRKLHKSLVDMVQVGYLKGVKRIVMASRDLEMGISKKKRHNYKKREVQ